MAASASHVPVAIIGYGYRLPGGLKNDDDFWKLLSSRGFVQEPIEDRYGKGQCPHDGFDSPMRVASPYEGLITEGDELAFDCALFGMSPNDAKRMDPQIKMMLSVTWEALESAGLNQAALDNSNTGVFTGQQVSSIAGWRPPFGATSGDVPGKSGSMIANRISFHFNWMGPSFSVATACSSGITALDAAIKSLSLGECDLAATGACNYLGQEVSSIGFNQLGIISKTGTSRSFDQDANGYMRSEGAFMYLLKRLPDAQRDGDKIFAVIRGCGLNTAGAEPEADVLTQGRMIVAPVGRAQQELMERVSQQAGISPLDVDYVEAHATGTTVGDATEGNAIAAAYGSPSRPSTLRLASSRSNVGHMEAASFTCSLLKVVLMMERREFLPVSAHHRSRNPKIPWDARRMRVLTSCEPFPDGRQTPVLIGINSFGFGGANGHCLVEEYRAPSSSWSRLPISMGDSKLFSVPLSAKSEDALVEMARRLAARLRATAGTSPVSDMYTLVANLCRRTTSHRVRCAFSAASIGELISQLDAFVGRADADELKPSDISRVQLKRAAADMSEAHTDGGVATVSAPTTLFVFPGQGSQWAGCGRRLYETEPTFQRVVDEIDAYWLECSPDMPKLSEVAFDDDVGVRLNECEWAQPVTFMVQAALFELLRSHGVHPDAVLGHSAGEAAAAYASGAYSLAEATRLVYDRARLQQRTAGCGRMLVLLMDRATTEAKLDELGFDFRGEGTDGDVVDLACFNSPGNTVVCGAAPVIAKLQQALQGGGKLIPGNIAFHSRHMHAIEAALHEALSVLDDAERPRCGPVPLLSTVSARVVERLDAEYWWSNVRRPVDLIGAIRTVRRRLSPDVIVEVSPHITLRSPIRDCYADADAAMPTYVPTLIRGADTAVAFADAIGACFRTGMLLDYDALFPRPLPVTHELPRYPMKKERVIDDLIDAAALVKRESFCCGPLLGQPRQGSHLQYQAGVSRQHFSWMCDHVVQETALIPASGYVELLLEAFGGEPIHLIHARFLAPFTLTADARYLHTDLEPCAHAPNKFEFTITSRPHTALDTASTVHCVGVLEKFERSQLLSRLPAEVPHHFPVAHVMSKHGSFTECMYADGESFYASMQARVGEAFSYGPFFRVIKRVDRDAATLNLRVEIEQDAALWAAWDKMGYVLHPTLLDGVLQIFIVYVMEAPDFSGVPQMMNDFHFVQKPSSEKLICVYEPPSYLKGETHQKGQLAFALGERPAGAIQIYDGATGDLIAYLGRYTSFHANAKKPDLRKSKHFLSWQPKDRCNAKEASVHAIAKLRERGTLGAAASTLIGDLVAKAHPHPDTPFFLNVAECIVGAPPADLALEACIGACIDAPVQFTSIARDVEHLSALYSRYGTSVKDAHLRFVVRPDDDGAIYAAPAGGMLRPAMFELLIVRAAASTEADRPERLRTELGTISRLLAPGGLLLVEAHDVDVNAVSAPPGFELLFESSVRPPTSPVDVVRGATTDEADGTEAMAKPDYLAGPQQVVKLWSAPTSLPEVVPQPTAAANATGDAAEPAGEAPLDVHARVVIDDGSGFSEAWRAALSAPPASTVDFAEAASWTHVDYFAMSAARDSGSADEVPLFDAPARLTEWVQLFASQRNGRDDATPCVFTVFTSGAVLDVAAPSQTGVWGATRTLALELGDACKVDFRLVDVGCKADLELAPRLEALRERELALHHGRLWTCRLVNLRESVPHAKLSADNEAAFRLTTDNSGAIADLHFRTLPLPPLGPNDVEIAVKGAALNFRDIMVGLGRLPLLSYERSALGRTVGIECSGVVVRVGSHVTSHEVGERVLAMQGGCIANRLRCHERAAFRMPRELSFEQGCSLLSVYVTAYYSLIHLARMRRGHVVLVHSAMGGVGQAAIALAKHVGAKVIGTAGSASRREKLLANGCIGAFDSHSTSWYRDVMSLTGGRGVDIVLNSLAGEHVDLCLEALAAGGWHCEIGKVDIYADRPLKMAVFRKNLAYRAIDIDRLMMDDPALAAQLTTECLELIEQGAVPTLPITCFEYTQHQAALRSMMGGLHEGKIVLTPPPLPATMSVGDTRPLFGVSRDGTPRTVLLSGCLGDFGLRVFSYVIAMGAKHILVLDRDPKRRRSVEWMRQHAYVDYLMPESSVDVRIEIVRADVSVHSDVIDAVAQVGALGMPPLGSVFHLAGILDDRFVADMDREAFAKVYAPKADGAWHLHLATQGIELDHFVMLSSTSSALGNPGQTNYSAANAFQDGLAAMRRQKKLAALSYCMGAVIEAGMAARNPQLLTMMKAGGMPALSSIFAIEVLDSALRSGRHSNAVAALAGERLSADLSSSDFLRSAGQLVHNSSAFRLGGGGALSKEALIERISGKVAALCGVDDVGVSEPLSSYGLNSISVAELGAYLKSEMSYTASAMQLMTSATCESIATGILAQQGAADASATATTAETATVDKDGESGGSGRSLCRPPRSASRFALRFDEHFEEEHAEHALVRPTASKTSKVAVVVPTARAAAIDTPPPNGATAEALTGSRPLGMLDGALPPKCQQALDSLLGFVHSFDTTALPPPTPVASLKRVLLTGATGFLGRHFISYLLSRKDVAIEKLYCPVRARNDDAALARVVDAMKACGLWRDELRSKLCVFAGDLHDIHYGASPALYRELEGRVDAVYHFASSLKLAASFDELRQANCEALLPVIKLCLSGRLKHLFLASTLGIFPQYFCQFGNEFADRPVARDAMPQIAEMKRLYPLYIGGYPWSKLLIELAAYAAASTHGLPLAVFRLPYLFSSGSTGYTVTEDPTIRLFQAVLQTRTLPGRYRPFAVEDADVLCSIMLNVSLNPRRRHTIYHCSRRSRPMYSECNALDMMGFHVASVPYAAFKAECQRRGAKSPLHTFWALIDHYAPYWIEHTRAAAVWPIDDATVLDDCHPLPTEPNAMEVTRQMFQWCFDHPELWPFEIQDMVASLSYEAMLRPAAKLCDAYGLDFDVAVPTHVRDGLRRICDELSDGHVRPSARPSIAFTLQSKLESRVHLHKLLNMHPEIADEPIDRPVFILGLNRTGTTFLHRLLEHSGAFAAPHVEEQNLLPTAEQIAHPEPEQAEERLEFFRSQLKEIADTFAGIHEMGVGLAEEDMCAHSHAFASLEYDIVYDLPKYRAWLDERDLRDVYREHRLWMQMTAWCRRRAGKPAERWCFKLPWHVRSLSTLLETYPDALIVHTHRPVKEVAGSWCSLVEKQRQPMLAAEVDRARLGTEQLEVLAKMLVAGTSWRVAHPHVSPRWLDVHFDELISRPDLVAARVIEHAGVRLDAPTSAALREYIVASRAKRSGVKLHQYDVGHYHIHSSAFASDAFVKYERDLASRLGLVSSLTRRAPRAITTVIAAIFAFFTSPLVLILEIIATLNRSRGAARRHVNGKTPS